MFLNQYTATVNIQGNDGEDDIYIGSANGVTDIDTGADADSVYVRSNSAVVTVKVFDADDYVEIGASANWDIPSGTFTVNNDGNLNGILADIFVEGGDHTTADSLTINDSANTVDRTFDIEQSIFASSDVVEFGTTGSVTYKEIESIVYELGSGDDVVNIKSTDVSMVTTINGNDGNDTYNLGDSGVLGSIDGLVNLYGDDGFDIINLDDSNAGVSNK